MFANKAEIESKIKQSYETKLQVLEAQYREKLQAKDEQIAIYRQHNTDILELARLRANQPIQNIIDITAESKSMSHTHKPKYDLSNANVGGIVDTAQSGSHQEFTQHNYPPEHKQTLAEAAAEIQKLLNQLSQNYPTNTTAEQMVVATEAIKRIENNPTLKQRIINAAKEGGLAALEKALDNPAGAFITSAIKGWLEAEAQ